MKLPRMMLVALAPLCIALVLWVWVIVSFGQHHALGRSFAQDYTVYLSAAHVVHDGGNPYGGWAAWNVNQKLIHMSERPSWAPLARVAEPPILVWALQPLAQLPFRSAVFLGEALALLFAVFGLWALARTFSLPGAPVLLIGLAVPPTLQYIYYGNLGVLLFAALGAGLWLARKHPFSAGVILSLTLCKPQVALPLAGLVLLFHSTSWRAALSGFAAGAALIFGGSALVMGPVSLAWWFHGLAGFGSTLSGQPPIASLPGLYILRVSTHLGLLLGAASLLIAASVTACVFLHVRPEPPRGVREMAPLWLLWFLAAPYDHFDDFVFLAPVLLALLASSQRSDRVRAVVLLYAVTLLIVPVPVPACIVPLAALVSLVPWQTVWPSRSHAAPDTRLFAVSR